ncbi:sigma-70 family RNA polymerase sigma factor [Stappia sp. ES.058]|uniref:sigma-70 family RNA polymerase sigma factor n=1 Tax=Stappia sp. ES.058 TaxID=1881061 RepID=UPI00087B5874|nr:sigma-70 family RNA polymerase sigma factor [Stappia sp. ES.058]SDU01654.1 RNA polymerase, sigma subunit, ECF family [Stappia sp. ES.058]
MTFASGASADATTSKSELAGLLDAVSVGDRMAFRDLYARTSAKLFGVVLGICKDRTLAEDVMQEAYLRVWRFADGFDVTRASPVTWLATVARNAAIDAVRARGRAGAMFDSARDGDDEDPMMRVADPTEHPAPWDLEALKACLASLETDHRRCVLLAYYEGYSREDLSERFDRPVGTIKTWLFRGLSALKACLGTS